MPNGEVHYKIWKRSWFVAIIMTAVLFLAYSDYWVVAAFVPIGYLLGRWISPDLDLVGINSDESRMMDDFKIFGAFMVAYWFPYAYLMRFVGLGRKGHRNFFSHFPVVGSSIRFVYLLFPFVIIFYYFSIPINPWFIPTLLGALIGLSIADTLHWAADTLESKSKKNRNKIMKDFFNF